MRFALSRVLRLAVLASLAFQTVPTAARQIGKGTLEAAPAPARTAIPWLYRGSDIPIDREWIFGELPNGVRYAVRRNGVPPRQVSIRVAIDAGSLAEEPSERGFAHFNEHLSFRGSKYIADGEAIRTWQRLGATFGSDTNASTTPTQTIYKLDLPSATLQGIDDSIKILSGMIASPNITPAAVDTERRTILAEQRERTSPQQRLGDAVGEIFYAGQRLGQGSTIGETAAIEAATAKSMRFFRDRWYRPSNTLVVIAGDADPAIFEQLIRKYFSDWKAPTPPMALPSYGKPSPKAARTKVIVEPGLPVLINLAVLRPWFQKNDTIEYNRGKLIDNLATRIVNRRLERRARAGGSFLTAQLFQDDVARSVDGTFVQIVPLDGKWDAALRDVRAVIAEAMTHPAAQDEIDREAGEFASALQQSVETSANDGGGELADNLVEAVNIRETVASPDVARDVFSNMKARLTPAAILASMKRLMTGAPLRGLLTLPAADPSAAAKFAAAITTDVKAGPAATASAAVTFDALPKLGVPGTVVKRGTIAGVGLQTAEFANGVKLVLYPHPTESGRIFVAARFGAGMKALPSDRPTLAFAADGALLAGGVGDLDQEALDRLTSARRINLSFDIDDDAFVLRGTTRPADLADQLRLMAAKLAFPRWDAAPVARIRAALANGFDSTSASPTAVLNRDLQGLLHGGDPRWTSATREQIAALTPEAFRAQFEPILAAGPIELSIYGDIDPDKAIADAAATFGALAPRAAQPVLSPATPSVKPTPAPLILTHNGPPEQAAGVLAWPTGGGIGNIYESRKLDILTQIFNDRLFDRLRGEEGAAYSPNVGSNWPLGMDSGGSVVVISQLKPSTTDRFFTIARGIAAELVATPVSADELARAVGPLRQLIARASTGSSFWLAQLGGVSFTPAKAAALEAITSDYDRITPAELQESAKRWLVPAREFRLVVLPKGK
jgi:zinc protease